MNCTVTMRFRNRVHALSVDYLTYPVHATGLVQSFEPYHVESLSTGEDLTEWFDGHPEQFGQLRGEVMWELRHAQA